MLGPIGLSRTTLLTAGGSMGSNGDNKPITNKMMTYEADKHVHLMQMTYDKIIKKWASYAYFGIHSTPVSTVSC